jgi:hypothetical protein
MKLVASRYSFACALVLFCCAGCAPPKFRAVTQIPQGRGLVYVYAPQGAVYAGTDLSHNGERIAGLGPEQYFIHFPEPGTNSYGFRMGYFSRGGLVGMMLTQEDPSATRLRIEAGRTYYLRMIGGGMNSSLWRVEGTTAGNEITNCHLVDIEKAKRVELTSH